MSKKSVSGKTEPPKTVPRQKYDKVAKEVDSLATDLLDCRTENASLERENSALKEENGYLREKLAKLEKSNAKLALWLSRSPASFARQAGWGNADTMDENHPDYQAKLAQIKSYLPRTGAA